MLKSLNQSLAHIRKRELSSGVLQGSVPNPRVRATRAKKQEMIALVFRFLKNLELVLKNQKQNWEGKRKTMTTTTTKYTL